MIGKQIDDSRSDEVDAADVIGSIRLIYKVYQKRKDRERQARNNRISKAFWEGDYSYTNQRKRPMRYYWKLKYQSFTLKIQFNNHFH